MKNRKPALIAGALLLAVLLTTAWADSILPSFLPQSGSIPGWSIVANSSRGGADDDTLYGIYDGAVPAMRDKGLVEAYQRIYQKGDDRMVVDVFRVANWQKAKAWFVQERDQNQGAGWYKVYDFIKQQAFIAESSGAIVGMFWQRQYVVQVGRQGSGGGDRYEAFKFLKYISNKIKARYEKED